MNGVTGRMGYRQHLVRSMLAIRESGGLPLRDGTLLWPEPVLVGRDDARSCASIAAAARPDRSGPPTWTRRWPTRRRDLLRRAGDQRPREGDPGAPSRPASTSTPRSRRPATLAGALELARAGATRPGVKHGVVQDKLFLPGLRKLDAAGRGRLLRPHPVASAASSATGSSRATGSPRSAQRGTTAPRTAAASSLDMFPHWHYVLEQTLRAGRAVTAHGRHPHPRSRWDERRPALRGDRRRRGVRHLRARRRRSSPRSTPPGRSGSTATSWSSSRSTAPRAAPSRGCATAGPAPVDHAQAGLEPRPAGHRAVPRPVAGCARQRGVPTTASRSSGSCSCGTWSTTRRTRWDLWAGARGVQLAELGPAVLARAGGRGPGARA